MNRRLGGPRTPWHLWVVGVVTLLWNAVGIVSYMTTRLGMLEQLGMTPDQIAFFDSYPVWANTFWALGVWGAFAGSILLLLRSRWAVVAMVIAIVGLLGTTYFQFVHIDLPESLSAPGLTAAIWATTFIMLFYAVRMRSAGVLK